MDCTKCRYYNNGYDGYCEKHPEISYHPGKDKHAECDDFKRNKKI